MSTIHYIEKGRGEVMILLHGNNEDSTFFKHQINYFSTNYKVIAPDTRGHGQSSRGNSPMTLTQFADDLKVFLEHKKIRKIILLGFSDGANTAILFTLKYPEYVSKLILNGANLYPAGIKFSIQYPIKIYHKFLSWLMKYDPDFTINYEIASLMVNEPHIHPSELFVINCPTLIIAGTNDMIKRAHTMLIKVCIPHSHICLIKGGHFIANKKSNLFNLKVAQFLNIY
jgi:pimeloyl-ACP methyl ester carboxylesterase